jgi:Iap family predicted aminopeptidase
VDLLRRPAFGVPTDGLVARRAGVPTITFTSVAADGGAPHYHQASDVLENVDLLTVADGVRLCRALIDEQRDWSSLS